MADGGLTQEEIDALLAGTGLDDFEEDEDDVAPPDSYDVSEPDEEQEIQEAKPVRRSIPRESIESQNLALLMDVKVTLTAELGRTKLAISDILSLGDGSIIELDKLVGEPVDLLVNDLIIGHANVVVHDEDYAIQITHLLDPMERFKILT